MSKVKNLPPPTVHGRRISFAHAIEAIRDDIKNQQS